MTTYRGKDGEIEIASNAIAEVKNFEIEETADTEEDTAMGDDWRTRKPGLKSWTGTIEAHLDDQDTNGQELLDIGAEVALDLFSVGKGSGLMQLSGSAIVTGVTRRTPMDDIVAITFGVTGNGALTKSAQV